MPIYTITVAGTNGKGSCVAMLECILLKAGYRVGVYSTPHLLRYNERIRLNGHTATDDLITASFARIDKARQETSLSYFEFGTLAALDIFSHQKLDIQILEVGLGGRLDAVNIIDADAALISSIDVDHVDWLGDDKSLIALEKAGVFRPRQKAVCGDKTVPESLVNYASSLATDLMRAGKDFDYQINRDNWCLIAEHSLAGTYALPALKGAHQIQNAAAVISLLAHIKDDVAVTSENISAGLCEVFLAGRLQQLSSQPDVFLDVAHNAESAAVLADFIKTRVITGRVHAVFSILADKDISKVVTPFIGMVDQWYIAPLNAFRAQTLAVIDGLLAEKLKQNCNHHESIKMAFTQAVNAADKDDLVICFGSFYVVEACLDAL